MLKDLVAALRPSLVMTALFALLLGLAYPSALTGVGQLLFPAQAGGSLILRDGQVVGSALIGQRFTSPGYFQGRPSAAGEGYDATASSGSNQGPAAHALIDRVRGDRGSLPAGTIPADSLTASASGLDPHISPAFAALQLPRVAAARGLPPAAVARLVAGATETPLLGFIGEPRVHVLRLNLALDQAAPRP